MGENLLIHGSLNYSGQESDFRYHDILNKRWNVEQDTSFTHGFWTVYFPCKFSLEQWYCISYDCCGVTGSIFYWKSHLWKDFFCSSDGIIHFGIWSISKISWTNCKKNYSIKAAEILFLKTPLTDTKSTQGPWVRNATCKRDANSFPSTVAWLE